jgi:hypothetical protein
MSGAAEFLFFGMLLLLLETSEKEYSAVERQELSDASARHFFAGWRQLKSHNL